MKFDAAFMMTATPSAASSFVSPLSSWSTSASPVVVREETAGSSPDHFAFPGLAKLSNGNLMISYRVGTIHLVETTAYQVYRTSTDGGVTWSAESTLYDPVDLDPRDSTLSVLSNGDVVATFFDHNGSTYQSGILKSSDNGSTWGSPVSISSSALSSHAISGPVVELSNGDLIAGIYGKKSGSSYFSTVLSKSTDGGATWSDVTTITDGDEYTLNCQEPYIIKLDDGRLFCAIRTALSGILGRRMYAISDDGGSTWTVANPDENVVDGRPCVIEAANGNLLLFIRRPIGNCYYVSSGVGSTWYGPATIDSGGYRGTYAQAVETSDNVIALAHGYEQSGADDSKVSFSYLYLSDGGTDPLA